MATTNIEPGVERDSRASSPSGVSRAVGQFAWQAIRIPLLAFLLIVEPVARFVLTAIALLGIVVSLFFELSGSAPRFPFWLIFGLSLTSGALVIVLNGVMRRLAR